MLKYLINGSEVEPDAFMEVLQTELPPETGEKIMTVAEQLIVRGEKRGMQQVPKNLLSNGLDIDFVAHNTGLDIELLKKLQEEFKH